MASATRFDDHANWEGLQRARRRICLVSERQSTWPSGSGRREGRERVRATARVANDQRGRVVWCKGVPGNGSIVRVRRARGFDTGGAGDGHHVDRRGDGLVDPSLARDASLARADGGEERTQHDDERGQSPRASEAAEDHLRSIAVLPSGLVTNAEIAACRVQISQFDNTNPAAGRRSSYPPSDILRSVHRMCPPSAMTR